MTDPTTEAGVIVEIKRAFRSRADFRFVRINAGTIADSHAKATSVKGVPDFIGGLRPRIGVGMEAKCRGKSGCRCPAVGPPPLYCKGQSAEQRTMQDVMRSLGLIYFVAHSGREAVELLEYWRRRP